MPTTGRMMYRTASTYGGTRQVFYTPAQKNAVEIVNGFMLDPTCCPMMGDKVFAGELGYYDYKTGLASHLKTFKAAKAITASDTEVYFEAGDFSHNPNGVVVMKAPNTANGTGASALIAATMTTLDGMKVYKATITAGALGTAAVGDIFVEAAEAGTGKTVKVPKVNMIFGGEIDIMLPPSATVDEYDKAVYTLNGYYENVVYIESLNIPQYILTTNKYNSNQLFKL